MTQINPTNIEKALQARANFELTLKSKNQTAKELLKHTNSWITHLEHDKNVYSIVLDRVIPEIDQFEAHFKTKLHKGKLPDRDFYNYLRQVEKDITDEKFLSEDFLRFMKNLEDLIEHIRGVAPDSKLSASILRAAHITHIKSYNEELKYLKEQQLKLTNDDERWTYFRNEFYAHRKELEELLKRRFHDDRLAHYIHEFFKVHHEDREGLLASWSKIVNHMSSSKGMLQAEREAMNELQEIIAKTINEVRDRLEQIRVKVLREFREQQKSLETVMREVYGGMGKLFEIHTNLLKGATALRFEQEQSLELIKTIRSQVVELENKNRRLVEEYENAQDYSQKNKIAHEIASVAGVIKSKTNHARTVLQRITVSEYEQRRLLEQLDKTSHNILKKLPQEQEQKTA